MEHDAEHDQVDADTHPPILQGKTIQSGAFNSTLPGPTARQNLHRARRTIGGSPTVISRLGAFQMSAARARGWYRLFGALLHNSIQNRGHRDLSEEWELR
jgi:hypothetical protein